ncbi:MAG TPA: DUF5941 domain-containing protein [Trebonia sp.]|jgi:hypothetical protein|nr:DUF5941 domain-containing protein [Trebonia sp.]
MTSHTTPGITEWGVAGGPDAQEGPDAHEQGVARDTSIVGAVARDVATWAAQRGLTPVALSGFSLSFAVIAAAWLTGISFRAEATAFVALVASFVSGRAARWYGANRMTATADWAQGACALLAELAVYAGIAGGVSANAGTGLTGPVGNQLKDSFLATLGGAGANGVWRLAVTAAILLAVREMANICVTAAKVRTTVLEGPEAARKILAPSPPSGIRLVLLCLVVMLAGARTAFALVLLLGVLALLVRIGVVGRNSGVIGYRGDGPLSVWIGSFVGGRLPPVPPLIVGLLVTGVLTWLGLGNLPGILVFTPAEAMLLAALGCWHPHDRARDWLVPPLIQTGEYVFLAALGFAGRVPAPVTFALLAAVAIRHFDLAYRARDQVSPDWFIRRTGRPPVLPGADWRGLGWEGRMIVAGIAAAAGILPYAYPVFAVYMWLLLFRDALTGWAAVSATTAVPAAGAEPAGTAR